VVEDETVFVTRVPFLRSGGYTVLEAVTESSVGDIHAIRNNSSLLSDMVMPRMAALNSRSEYGGAPATKVVLMSGYAEFSEANRRTERRRSKNPKTIFSDIAGRKSA